LACSAHNACAFSKEGAPVEQLGQMIGAANQKGTPRRAFCNVQNVRD